MINDIPEGYEWFESSRNYHLVISKEALRKDQKILSLLWQLFVEIRKGTIELDSIKELLK